MSDPAGDCCRSAPRRNSEQFVTPPVVAILADSRSQVPSGIPSTGTSFSARTSAIRRCRGPVPGGSAVGRFVYRGTHAGEFMGIPASGSPVEMRSIDIWRVKDGMFAEHWDELNLLEMFQQMGALPPVGAGPEGDP